MRLSGRARSFPSRAASCLSVAPQLPPFLLSFLCSFAAPLPLSVTSFLFPLAFFAVFLSFCSIFSFLLKSRSTRCQMHDTISPRNRAPLLCPTSTDPFLPPSHSPSLLPTLDSYGPKKSELLQAPGPARCLLQARVRGLGCIPFTQQHFARGHIPWAYIKYTHVYTHDRCGPARLVGRGGKRKGLGQRDTVCPIGIKTSAGRIRWRA